METNEAKRFEKPRVEFVAIDDDMATNGAGQSSSCLDEAYQTAYQMCGCTNSTSYEEAVCPDSWV